MQAAQQIGMEPEVLAGIIQAESGGNPQKENPKPVTCEPEGMILFDAATYWIFSVLISATLISMVPHEAPDK